MWYYMWNIMHEIKWRMWYICDVIYVILHMGYYISDIYVTSYMGQNKECVIYENEIICDIIYVILYMDKIKTVICRNVILLYNIIY